MAVNTRNVIDHVLFDLEPKASLFKWQQSVKISIFKLLAISSVEMYLFILHGDKAERLTWRRNVSQEPC